MICWHMQSLWQHFLFRTNAHESYTLDICTYPYNSTMIHRMKTDKCFSVSDNYEHAKFGFSCYWSPNPRYNTIYQQHLTWIVVFLHRAQKALYHPHIGAEIYTYQRQEPPHWDLLFPSLNHLNTPPSKSLASLGAQAACRSIDTHFGILTVHDKIQTGIILSS